MKLITKIISSLGKIYPDEVMGERLEKASLLKNEPFSFQVAFKNEDYFNTVKQIYVRVETDLDIKLISEYLEGLLMQISLDLMIILKEKHRDYIRICC